MEKKEMKVERSLLNRIRGWFPQEPKINNITIANGASTQDTWATDLHMYKKEFSPNQNRKFLLIIAGWAIWLLISFGKLPHLNFAGLIVAGLITGLTLAVIPIYLELKKLTITGSSSVKISEILFIVLYVAGPVFVLGSAAVQGTVYFYELQYSILTVYLSSIMSGFLMRALLFTAWERKHKADIMRGKGYAIVSAQKTRPVSLKRFFGKEPQKRWIS